MAPKGKIFPLTVEIGNFVGLPALPINGKGLTLQGSTVAPRQVFPKMLAQVAQHGIKPIIETFPMTEAGIAQAMERVESGKMYSRTELLEEAPSRSRSRGHKQRAPASCSSTTSTTGNEGLVIPSNQLELDHEEVTFHDQS